MTSVLTLDRRRRAPRRALCILLPLLGLAGCTTLGPDFQLPASDVPDSWSQWHSGAVDSASLPIDQTRAPERDWWLSFGDGALNALQARLHNGPDLQDALLNFTQARLQRQLVAGEQGVQLDASGSAGRQRVSEYGAEVRMASIATAGTSSSDSLVAALAQPYSLYQAGFDASWELDLWGRIGRSIEAAAASSDAAGALLAQTRLSLSAELSRLYFELRAVQRQSRLLQQEIELHQQQLALQQADVAAGRVSEISLETRRSELQAQRAGWRRCRRRRPNCATPSPCCWESSPAHWQSCWTQRTTVLLRPWIRHSRSFWDCPPNWPGGGPISALPKHACTPLRLRSA